MGFEIVSKDTEILLPDFFIDRETFAGENRGKCKVCEKDLKVRDAYVLAKSHGQAEQGSCLVAHSCAARFVYLSASHFGEITLQNVRRFAFMPFRSCDIEVWTKRAKNGSFL